MSTPDSPVSPDQVLDDLVEATPTGAARLDGQGRAVRVNARWEATTGRPASQALGDGWTGDIDPDGRAEFLADLTDSLATRTALRGRLRFLADDGTTRWVDLSTSPIGDPTGGRTTGDAGALLTVVDVSDEMDEARRAQELTRVLEATPDPVAVLDPTGEYVVWG